MSHSMDKFMPEEKFNIPSSGKRFIESVRFPFPEVSEASRVEKGPGRPPHWEMIFWWTRKPLISARAVIAGSLLPDETSKTEFLHNIGIGVKKTAHNIKPSYHFEGVKLLDPFAGFGSIPLEALRLGLDAVAVELLPTTYVFLKAVLEYPTKYGKKLVKDVKKWGEWVTERLKEDPIIKELYEQDVAVYIGSWEIKCPNCGRWTPLIGNWWLARVKGKEGYERLAFMKPKIAEDKVEIEIVDLNRIYGDNAVKKAKVEENKINIEGKEYRVPEANIEARRELGICLHCSQPIMQVDPKTGKHYTETKNLPKEVKESLKSYIKFALELYNKDPGYGTNTELPPWTNGTPARQRLLAKVKTIKGDLEFEPCTEKDQEKLEKAMEEVKKLMDANDSDVPRESLWRYTASGGGCLSIWVWGFDKFYTLFNPRQFITLIKLVKLIREAGKQIEQEKIKEGLDPEKAQEYAEAITTYLAIASIKQVDHNTLATCWHPVLLIIAHTLSMRGIAMMWNWTDENPLVRFTGSWIRSLENIVDGLSYLISAVSNSPSNVKVLLDDATILRNLNSDSKFDLIVTDPPYYDDVPYAELSDFYYIWIKRALSDVGNGRLVPRFLPEAFFEKVGDSWVEVSTQWEKYALSEVSLNPPRLGSNVEYKDGVKHFQNLLNASFATMASRLRNDGLLVTYYAHTSPDAWKALLGAGWLAASLRVTNAFPITTESAESVVSRGKLSMDTSIVVVWRKGAEGTVNASELYERMAEESADRAKQMLDMGITGRDLIVGTLAAALSVATRYRKIMVMGELKVEELVDKYVYPATYLGLARALARKAELKDTVRSSDGMFYLLVKSVFAGAKKKIIESTDARIFSIGTSLDLEAAAKSLKLLGSSEREAGARVAKAKTLTLMEPSSSERSKLMELLETRGVGVSSPNIRCSVDALHFIEYLAVSYSREEFRRRLEELKAKFASHVQEAIILAETMSKVLPEEDVEKALCERVTEYLKPYYPELSKGVR